MNLFIVNTMYQLINTINIAMTIEEKGRHDVLISDHTPALHGKLKDIESTGLFQNVYYAETIPYIEEVKKYPPSKIIKKFEESYKHIPAVLDIDWPKYKKIYFANYDMFTRGLAHYYTDNSVEFIEYDEGFGNYVTNFKDKDRMESNQYEGCTKLFRDVKIKYLYEPELVMYEDGLELRKLPKISKKNKPLVQKLNQAFNYNGEMIEEKCIFIEQPFLADNIKNNDIELIYHASQKLGFDNFSVRPHPRNPYNRAFRLGISKNNYSSTPWELIILNNDMKERILITVCSNAVLTPKMLFDEEVNVIMLYRLIKGKILWKETDVVIDFMQKFLDYYKDKNYMVPETMLHYDIMLDKLTSKGGNGEWEN